MEKGISARLTPTEGRKFGLLVGGAFLVAGALMWRRGHLTAAGVSAVLGAALVIGGLAAPVRLEPVYRAWMGLALAISKVTTPIVMAVLWFLVITPAGYLVRRFGHRPLVAARGAATHWYSRPTGQRQSALDHQY